MQGKQAFISGAYRVVELGAPGRAGEHAEEVLQLCVRQGSILVLPKHRESPGQAGAACAHRGPATAATSLLWNLTGMLSMAGMDRWQ